MMKTVAIFILSTLFAGACLAVEEYSLFAPGDVVLPELRKTTVRLSLPPPSKPQESRPYASVPGFVPPELLRISLPAAPLLTKL